MIATIKYWYVVALDLWMSQYECYSCGKRIKSETFEANARNEVIELASNELKSKYNIWAYELIKF